MDGGFSAFLKLKTLSSVSGYRLYKRYYRSKLPEKDSERTDGDADTASCKDKQEYALTNGGFQSDENGNTEGKGKVTHL